MGRMPKVPRGSAARCPGLSASASLEGNDTRWRDLSNLETKARQAKDAAAEPEEKLISRRVGLAGELQRDVESRTMSGCGESQGEGFSNGHVVGEAMRSDLLPRM